MDHSPFWNVRDDFASATPVDLVAGFHQDDRANLDRGIVALAAELALVDRGLELYIEPLRAVLVAKDKVPWTEQLRATVAMFENVFNVLLAQRLLILSGYLAEARPLTRRIHEAMAAAMAFHASPELASKFYQGRQIPPKAIREAIAKGYAATPDGEKLIYLGLQNQYGHLSDGAHPGLESFHMRVAVKKPGKEGLRESVPEDVVFGGLIQLDLGKIGLLGLARNIADGLAFLGVVLTDEEWSIASEVFRNDVASAIREHDEAMDAEYADD